MLLYFVTTTFVVDIIGERIRCLCEQLFLFLSFWSSYSLGLEAARWIALVVSEDFAPLRGGAFSTHFLIDFLCFMRHV